VRQCFHKLHSDEVPASETTSHTHQTTVEDDRRKVLYVPYVCDISERTQYIGLEIFTAFKSSNIL